MALLNHPELVILDEPMNGLDVEATILVRKIIKDYASHGTAFLISSHVLSELKKVMGSVIIINNGQVIMETTVDKFRQGNEALLMLKTTDMPKTKQLVKPYLLPEKQGPDCLVIHRQDSIKVQQLLTANQIWITELRALTPSFEQAIVKILREKRGEAQ